MNQDRMKQLAGIITESQERIDPALNVAEELLDWARRFSHGISGGQKAPMGKIEKSGKFDYTVSFPYFSKKLSMESGMYSMAELDVKNDDYNGVIAISYKGKPIVEIESNLEDDWSVRKAFAKILTFLDRELNKRAY